MKNICFFSGDITRGGGTERVAIMIANELNKDEKYNVSFVSLNEEKADTFYELDKAIKRYVLYTRKVRGITHFLGYVKRLKKVVKENNIDVLVDIDGIIDIYSVFVKKMTGVKVISWEHFNYYHHPNQKIRQKVRKYVVPRVDGIVTLTEEDKGYYKKAFNIKCPIRCIYNPCLIQDVPSEYNLSSKTLISVGRLTYQKGFDMAIEVAKEILPNNKDWKWIILGEGEDRQYLEEKIGEYGLQEQFLLLGQKKDIEKYYSDAAIFVMTSRFEGLPMTLLESKTYRLPIVSYKCKTGPSELVVDGINGYLIEENDNKGMAQKLELLMTNKEKRKSFSDKALENMNKFKLDSIIYDWKKLLGEILE